MKENWITSWQDDILIPVYSDQQFCLSKVSLLSLWCVKYLCMIKCTVFQTQVPLLKQNSKYITQVVLLAS